jgi:hypothetical protein
MFAILIILITVVCFIIGLLVDFYSIDQSDRIPIKLDSFIKFYRINPERWQLYSHHVGFRVEFGNYKKFKFNFIDYYRYKLWLYKKNKQDTEISNCKAYQEVLEVIQEDINKFKEQSAADEAEALRKIWDIK